MVHFGNYLRWKAAEMGGIKAMADATGVAYSTLQMYCRRPSPDGADVTNLIQIAQGLKLDGLADLLAAAKADLPKFKTRGSEAALPGVVPASRLAFTMPTLDQMRALSDAELDVLAGLINQLRTERQGLKKPTPVLRGGKLISVDDRDEDGPAAHRVQAPLEDLAGTES